MTTPRQASTDSTPYWKLLKDARWQRKRLEIMQRDNFTCIACGRSDKDEGTTLNVHHAYYIKGVKPWEYGNHLLTTRCSECHEEMHEDQHRLLQGFSTLSTRQQKSLVDMVFGNKMPEFLEFLIGGPSVSDRAITACLKGLKFAYDHGYTDREESEVS